MFTGSGLRPELQPAGVSAPGPMAPERFRVAARRQETADTWTLELEPLDRTGGFRFLPGQFTMLYAFGAGEVPISISGDPAKTERLVHTVRAVGAASAAICRTEPGRMLGVRGPFGSHWPVADAEGRDVVVVAGGIGLAPLRPIVHEVLGARERFRNALLLYGGREPEQLLYSQELEEWRERGLDVDVTVDIAPAGWPGKVGVVPALIDRARFDADGAVAFVCGPEPMIRFSAGALIARGVDARRVHVSMERNMKCAVGHCGHCQLGPEFVCRDGPVFTFERMRAAFDVREV
jgi:NAD(P)H-flavin reductase